MKTIKTNRVSKFIGCCGLLWVALSGAIQANNDWYVATNATHDFDSSSWDTAFTNIQAALDAATSNDTIHLAGHTFAVTHQLVWTNSFVSIRGGYEADAQATLPGADKPDQWPTVITRNPAYNTRILLVQNVTNSLLEQVTIRDGNIPDGAGLAISSGTVILENITVADNNTEGLSVTGGAVDVLNSIRWGHTENDLVGVANVAFSTVFPSAISRFKRT